jgi:hypothetical protein
MGATMTHSRKLVLGAVALTKARILAKQSGAAANRVRDDLENEMIASGYLDNAPFKWVSIIIRYGLIDESTPHYDRVSQKHGDLPLAIEIDTHRLVDATEDEMVSIYRKAVLTSLVHAGEKYGLNVERMRELVIEA